MQAELALAVGDSAYRIWLASLRPCELDRGRLVLEAPSTTRAWIRERFGRVLESCAAHVIEAGVTVEIVDVRGSVKSLYEPRASTPHEARTSAFLRERESRPGPLGNPKLTFEQFVIGDSNRLAHAAALTVAEMPAHAYNPLFICGPPGVGKTHLLSSIAKLLLSYNPGLAVRCTTGEAFTNEFIEALAGRRTEAFKARFRDIDVLLLDDVQFLERKAKTEEELFHTFNALHDGGRQIVLTSDRPPNDLQALEDRLRERFGAGLVADIGPPDIATRLTILRKRAQHDDVDLADERALHAIAERVDSNVRALEGALIRVVAFSSLTGRALTRELAGEVLDKLYPRPARDVHDGAGAIGEIQAAVGEHFGVSRQELLSTSRNARIAWPRQLAMYLVRELTSESLPAIGRHFGGRDHTTVMHACRRTSARIDDDDAVREAVEKLRATLTPSTPRTHQTPTDRIA
jgi:chromosomal replication initiator protein